MNKDTLDQKWNKLLELVDRFKFVPFVDFVLVAGSMAMRSARDDSDFDLIIGTKDDRIFTVRQISAGVFQLDGSRRSKNHSKQESKDKICLNHFVTKDSYKLDAPHNKYWNDLYSNLVPVYGNKDLISDFLSKNDWVDDFNTDYNFWIGNHKSFTRKILEFLLGGILGNFIEKLFKKYQINKIENSLRNHLGYKPYIKYDSSEIRFHMDTKRTEEYIKKHE